MADDTGTGAGASSSAGSSPAPSTATSSTSTGSTTPASATGTPQQTGGAATTTERGPIPYDRHESILHGAYSERDAAQKALQDNQQKYGWADQFQTDPASFVETWMDQLAENPQLSPRILAKAARMLQSRRGSQPAPAAQKPKPDVPIVDNNGQITGYAYSAEQLDQLDAFNWEQREAKFNERLAPIEEQKRQADQREFVAQIQQQSDQSARTTLTELRTHPHFKEHEPKVKAALMAHPEWGDNIHAAFNHVLVTDILPNLSSREAQKVVDSLQQKAGASTVNPGGTSSSSTPKFTSFGEASKYYSEHPEEARAMANRR